MAGHGWPVGPTPASGHVTTRGFWHPGAMDGCVKCDPDDPGSHAQWAPSVCPRSANRTHLINKVPGSSLPFGACVSCGYVPPR